MTEGTHDTLVYRLASTLIKFNQGEHIDPNLLAHEYGVTLRTIQRDLNVRFAYLPIQKTNGLYHLDPIYLGKLTRQDIDRFAGLAGIKGLFPSLTDEFLEQIFDTTAVSSLAVRGHNYEKMKGKEKQFSLLDKSISLNKHITFHYLKKGSLKKYLNLCPYKLINDKGIWYLMALDGDKTKTFSFTKISQLHVNQTHFKPKPKFQRLIAEDDSVWVSEDKIDVLLSISKEVADYFLRRKLIANQVIEEQLDDGGLILSTKISHFDQLTPIIKYWIPHIQVKSPNELKLELETQLKNYLA